MPLNGVRFFSAVAGGSHLCPHARLIASHSSTQDLQAHLSTGHWIFPQSFSHPVSRRLMTTWTRPSVFDVLLVLHAHPRLAAAYPSSTESARGFPAMTEASSALLHWLVIAYTYNDSRYHAPSSAPGSARIQISGTPEHAAPDKPRRLCPGRHSGEASDMPMVDMSRSEPSGPSFSIASCAVGELDQDWLGVSARRPPPARPERRQAGCACYGLWRTAACRTQQGSWCPTPCLEALKRLGSFRAADAGWGLFSNWASCLSAEGRITPSARYKEISFGVVSHPPSLPPSFRLTTCLLLHWRMEKSGERRLASMDWPC